MKACGFKASTVKWLVQKIKKQKSQYDSIFRGNEYSLVITDSEIEFMQSSNISLEGDVRTQEDVEKLLKQTAKAGYILSKLYKARDSYHKCTKFEAQKQAIETLKKEVKTLKETSVAVTDGMDLSENESETVGTTATYESFDAEPSIICNHSPTQTDIFPTISLTLFRKLNNIRLEFPSLEMHLSKLEENYESTKLNNALTLTSNKQAVQNRMYDLKTIALAKRQLVSIAAQQATEFTLLVLNYRKLNVFPKGSEKRQSVLTCLDDSNTFYNEHSFEGPKPNQRCSSSQTEISTLLIRPEFGDLTAKDNVITKIEKLHGKFITYSYESTKFQVHGERLKQYCKDLNDGKHITVFESDLSDELIKQIRTLHCNQDTNNANNCVESCVQKKTAAKSLSISRESNSIDDMQLVHHEIFEQLERKVKATFKFEIGAAIKKSTDSFKNLQLSSNHSNQERIEELEKELHSKDNIIDEQSKRITEIQTKLNKQISDEESKTLLLTVENVEAERKLRCEKLKVNEKESEISKLNTKISNQSKTNSQQQIAMNAKCKEIEKLKKEVKKSSSQQTSQSEVNKLKSKIRQGLKLMLDFGSVHA